MDKVFIVTFEGAYGLQIEGVFESHKKARKYCKSLPEHLQYNYNYEIKGYEVK